MINRHEQAYAEASKRLSLAGRAIAVCWVLAAILYRFDISDALVWILSVGGLLVASLATTDLVNLIILSRWIKALKAESQRQSSTDGGPTPDFQLVSKGDESWYERRVRTHDDVILIRVSSYTKSQQTTFAIATEIISNIDTLNTMLKSFIYQQKPKFSQYYDDMESLTLSSVTILSPYESDVIDIAFRRSPSGRVWTCSYKQGRFFELGFDN